jgi:hypothetical protein
MMLRLPRGRDAQTQTRLEAAFVTWETWRTRRMTTAWPVVVSGFPGQREERTWASPGASESE